MPGYLATVVRFTVIASLILTGCSISNPGQESALSQPVETSTQVALTRTTNTETSTPTPTPSPTLTTIPKPTHTPTSTPEIDPTPVIIDQNNLDELAPIYTLDHQSSSVTAVAFSPDNSILASSSEDGLVRVWQALDGKLLYTLMGHIDIVNSLAFSPDGELLASASADSTVRLWDVRDGSLVRTIDTSLIGKAVKVEFSKDGSVIAIAGNLCFIVLRNSDTGLLRRTIKQPHCLVKTGGPVVTWGLVFTPDNLSLITGEGQPGGSGGSIQIWDYEKYEPPQVVRGYDLVVHDLSLSADGTTIAVALSGSPEIWLMKVPDGKLVHQLKGHTFRVNSVRYSSNGSLLASAGRDMTVRLWDPATGKLLYTLDDHTAPVNSAVFSFDGSLIASGSDAGTVIVWGLAQP